MFLLSIAKKVLGLFSRKKNIPPQESNSIGEKAKVDDSTNEVIIIFRTKDKLKFVALVVTNQNSYFIDRVTSILHRLKFR